MYDQIILGSIMGAAFIYCMIDAVKRLYNIRTSHDVIVKYRVICRDERDADRVLAQMQHYKKFHIPQTTILNGFEYVSIVESVKKGETE